MQELKEKMLLISLMKYLSSIDVFFFLILNETDILTFLLFLAYLKLNCGIVHFINAPPPPTIKKDMANTLLICCYNAK